MRLVKKRPNIFMLLSPVCCVLVLLLLFVAPSLARDFSNDRRTALVVGNNNYLFGKLNNPVNDAKDMAAALRKLGFQVDLQLDTNRKSFRTAIRDFGNRLQQGGVGLFYFAGHGMQIDGENFLIPVDADIQSEDEIPDYGISANTVLRKMEAAGNPLNMVFLDACRDNPFARSFRSSQSGMARMDAPSGSLIVYATAIGHKAKDGDGRNGTFTSRLLKYLPQPNLEVGMLLRQVREDVKKNTGGMQVPWSSSSLIGRFYFKKMDIKASPQQRDHEFWAAVKKSDRASDYLAYLEEFPAGENNRLARLRISQLEKPHSLRQFADNVSGIEFEFIRGGCYLMGWSESRRRFLGSKENLDKWWFDDKKTRHEFCVDDFYVAKYEVTVGQFRRFVHDSGYRTDAEKNIGGKVGCLVRKEGNWGWRKGMYWDLPDFKQQDNQPVVCVSWNDSQKYISWLNKKSGKHYRLASEAEWEYAVRGGTETIRFLDDDPAQTCKYANVADQTESPEKNHAWVLKHECNDGYFFTAPVGHYRPNPYGLYDMLGNVWEWTNDKFDSSYDSQSPRSNLQGSVSGSSRVFCGGSWASNTFITSVAFRIMRGPAYRDETLGFRLVSSPE